MNKMNPITENQLMVNRRQFFGRSAMGIGSAALGSLLQRDGLAEDPVGWMVSPLELFEGRAPIEACMERSACSKAILLHGLGLGLDADPAVIDRLLFDHSVSLESGRG